jgi:hypothetical protein
LAVIEGWHQDKEYSVHYGVNAQAPVGSTFRDAETVIYARAIFKPRVAGETLLRLVEKDLQTARGSGQIEERAGVLKTAEGMPIALYNFVPQAVGNWERAGYGENEEYFFIFVVSSRTQSGYLRALPAYGQFIQTYR